MKRVKAACICQTLHFTQKDDLPQEEAAVQVQREVAHYKATLERSSTKYKIEEETVQPDGSVIIRLIKQYNASPVGSYLD